VYLQRAGTKKRKGQNEALLLAKAMWEIPLKRGTTERRRGCNLVLPARRNFGESKPAHRNQTCPKKNQSEGKVFSTSSGKRLKSRNEKIGARHLVVKIARCGIPKGSRGGKRPGRRRVSTMGGTVGWSHLISYGLSPKKLTEGRGGAQEYGKSSKKKGFRTGKNSSFGPKRKPVSDSHFRKKKN